MHQASEYSGALFQVASQFNALEMTGFEVTPEHGVTRYMHDRTQGPACAIAAGAATIYRNYFVPLAGGVGQTAQRQLNGLARCLKQVLSADPKPWEVWPGGKPFETPDAWTRAVTDHHWEVLVRIANEFGGEEGKAVAALAYKLPEPWTSG